MIRYSTFLPNNVIPIIYLVLNKLNNKYISFFLLYCRKMSSHALQQQKILKQTLDGTISVVCCRRQPKIKPILLKIYVVVRVKIVPTESIQPSFMLREQGGGGGFEYNENNFKKNNKGTIQIKVSKSIKRTNLGLSQHPPSEFYN